MSFTIIVPKKDAVQTTQTHHNQAIRTGLKINNYPYFDKLKIPNFPHKKLPNTLRVSNDT